MAQHGQPQAGLEPLNLSQVSLDYSDALMLASDCPQLQLSAEQLFHLRQVERLLEQFALCQRSKTPAEELRQKAAAALAALE